MRRGVLLLVGALVLAACADDDDAATATTANTATASTGAERGAETSATTGTAGPSSVAPNPGSTSPPAAGPAPTSGAATSPSVAFTEIAARESPVDLAWRAGDDALYVAEQGGRIMRLAGDASDVVLDATELTEAAGEQGLLGLTFGPGGDVAYTNYTDLEGNTTIIEYPLEADGTFLDGDNTRVLFVIEQPYDNHNGGDLTFGPDGMLYIGMGDGGSGGDPERRATDLSSPLGKMLRVDPTPAGGEPYTVPDDNPFVGQDGADPRIWSSGLRNPWRFSFDRATGDLWIADVGQDAVEEIDVAPATDGVDAGRGLSFGWSAFEGNDRFNDDVPADGHTPPLATYPNAGDECSISGGVRVRDGSPLDGWYVYADYCSGRVAALEVLGEGAALQAGRTVELGNVDSPTAVVEGPAGEIYVLSAAGPVLRLDPA